MLTRCPSCGTSNRIRPWRGDARCGKCRTDLVLPRPIGFLQRHRRAVLVLAFLAVAAPGLAYYGGRAQRWNERGCDLAEAGKQKDAIAAFARAIEIDPSLSKAHYNMGLAYTRLGQFDQAVRCFRRALDVDPANTDASAWLTRTSRVVDGRHR